MVVAEYSTETLAGFDLAVHATDLRSSIDNLPIQALMIPLSGPIGSSEAICEPYKRASQLGELVIAIEPAEDGSSYHCGAVER
jgi:hypothetical protein